MYLFGKISVLVLHMSCFCNGCQLHVMEHSIAWWYCFAARKRLYSHIRIAISFAMYFIAASLLGVETLTCHVSPVATVRVQQRWWPLLSVSAGSWDLAISAQYVINKEKFCIVSFSFLPSNWPFISNVLHKVLLFYRICKLVMQNSCEHEK